MPLTGIDASGLQADQVTAALASLPSGIPAMLQAVIDAMPFGLAFIDTFERIAAKNEAADRILAASDGLSLRHGRLTASLPQESQILRMLIRETLRPAEMPALKSRILRLSRPSGRQPLILLVASLVTGAGPALKPSRLAMVLISAHDETPNDQIRLLQRAYGLSLAEAEIAVALVEDAPIRVAEIRHVSISTIRSQIKSILAKTGARRQSDLIKLISRLPASLSLESIALSPSASLHAKKGA